MVKLINSSVILEEILYIFGYCYVVKKSNHTLTMGEFYGKVNLDNIVSKKKKRQFSWSSAIYKTGICSLGFQVQRKGGR